MRKTFFLVILFLLAGCGKRAETTLSEGEPAISFTPALTNTATPVLTAAPLPSAAAAPETTPEPAPSATNTPLPTPTATSTPTPTPTPTPSVLEQIEEAGETEGGLQEILTADAFLLVNMTRNDVLYSYRALEILYPASITKLMTAYLALEYGNPDDMVTFSQTAVTPVIPSAMMCGFKAGDQIKLRDLLICMLLFSGNDTAVAVAEHISGSEAEFVVLMNKEAESLGMTDTYFCNAHGLPDDAHVTSAYDIYLIMEKLFCSDEFLDIISLQAYSAPYKNKKGEEKEIEVMSTNFFLSEVYSTPEGITMLGGKTGTTNKAGYCLCVYVKDEAGDCYIAEIFGADTRTDLYEDMITLLTHISDSY